MTSPADRPDRSEVVAALRKLVETADAATAGPWCVWDDGDIGQMPADRDPDSYSKWLFSGAGGPDAELVAAAPLLGPLAQALIEVIYTEGPLSSAYQAALAAGRRVLEAGQA